MGEKQEMIDEAIQCASDMRDYCIDKLGKDPYHWLEKAASEDSMFEDLYQFAKDCGNWSPH
jgi:hypothetical protein